MKKLMTALEALITFALAAGLLTITPGVRLLLCPIPFVHIAPLGVNV